MSNWDKTLKQNAYLESLLTYASIYLFIFIIRFLYSLYIYI